MTRRTPSQYKWDKLQFDERILKKHFTSMKTFEKKFVVIHHMTIVGKGTGSANNTCYNVWQSRPASAHYGVDGKYVMQFVWDKDFAWSTGSNQGNLYGISIECANQTAGPKWLVSEDTMQTAARLAAQLHVIYKFGRPKSDSNGRTGTLRQHDTFVSTACPGPYLGGTEWNRFVKMAQTHYDQITKGEDPDMAMSDADMDKLVEKLKKELFRADVVPIEDPIGTPESRAKNPKWQVLSTLGVTLRELVRTRNMVAEIHAKLVGEKPADPPGKA